MGLALNLAYARQAITVCYRQLTSHKPTASPRAHTRVNILRMPQTTRLLTADDQTAVAQIILDAFSALDAGHDVPTYLANIDEAQEVAAHLFGIPKVRGFGIDDGGQLVGVGFLHDLGDVGMAISPLAVAPAAQARGVGQAILDRMVEEAGDRSIRLLQDAFNNGTLALYAHYGFIVREQLTCVTGQPADAPVNAWRARATGDDARAEALHRRVMGFDRPSFPTRPIVTKHDGELDGFIVPGTEYPFAVAERESTLKDLIRAIAQEFDKPVTLAIPAAHTDTLRWMLDNHGRVIRSMNLMIRGTYTRPDGARLNSGSY
jgi:GNAT superfamily N-acetyltransferase